MNPESLDSLIQSCLSALYPPFEVTASTVLGQLFQVIEGRYHGDALQCLTDFLIPARHLLESVQQAACAPYPQRVFRFSGWPLCLHDRIVIQLAPVNPLLLKPGDFYLQIVPFGNQAARIVVQSLLEVEEERELQETPIPENSYPDIFTEAWLRELNEGRHGRTLACCVLKTQQGIVKVPWIEVANPEFEDNRRMASSSTSNQPESLSSCLPHTSTPSSYSVETRIRPARDGIAVSLRLVDNSSSSRHAEMDPAQSAMRPVGWVSPNTWDSRSPVGNCKDLMDLTKETQGYSQTWTQTHAPLLRSNSASRERTACVRTVRFAEEPCTPCMQRKHGQGTKAQKCRYAEAQEKPIKPKERTEHLSILHRSAQGNPACCSSSETGPSGSYSSRDQTHNISQDKIHCFTPAVVGTSEKCHIVVQGETNEADRSSYFEMIPRLHVVPGKKSTAFGLVSPKIQRRRLPAQDLSQDSKTLSPPATGPRINLSDSSAQAETERPPSRSSTPPALTADGLFHSGMMCLTGGQDRSGRAVVEIYGDHQVWASATISSQEICKLLLYFHTITRKEKDLGTTVVFDARKKPPHPEIAKALLLLQEVDARAVHWVLLLLNKDNSHSHEKRPGLTMETVTSLKALYKIVDAGQLTAALHGSFQYNHCDWLQIHQKLYPFVSDLQEASALLSGAIKTLEGVHKIDTVQDVQQCIEEQGALMKDVLGDARLVGLQRGSGTMLARLRRETEVRSPDCEKSREVIDTVTHLYNSMEEQVHILARKSNMSLQHLDFLLQLREMESRFAKIKDWFDTEGEARLQQAESVEDCSERIQQTLQGFKAFLSEANERKHQAMMLVSDAESVQGPNYPETEVFHRMVSVFKSGLSDFVSRAERCCEELSMMVYICHFCERASAVAGDCRLFLDQEQYLSSPDEERWTHLHAHLLRLDEFSPEHFQEARAQACSSSRALQVWDAAWIHCQETRRQLEERLGLLEGVQTTAGHPSDRPEVLPAQEEHPSESRASRARDSIHGTVTCFNFRSSHKSRKEAKSAPTEGVSCRLRPERQKSVPGAETRGRLEHGGLSVVPLAERGRQNRQQGTRAPHHRARLLSGGPRRGRGDPRRLENGWRTRCIRPESPNATVKLHRIMEELLLTEAEYVRSLGYILTHYFPLLSRPDVPQDLRGQRGRIFGNLEKLYDFHCQHFQRDLEAGRSEPLRVGRCFLRHRESFGLYALYSKNKPQSDALIQHHRYFKRKQMELGDSMDLSSYLLKPVQRISKYSLLLQEILDECVPDQSGEREEIQAALEVVRFQLRHGNDLLTMDAVRDCDLNLNEQGQLIRQDEFWVIFRKKRSLRRVFLFQDVILFTKTKKNDRGDDVYVYKMSIKTCEIGMTHSCGVSGRSFEIWFRRRRSQDTYILQAETRDAKEAWTRDLEHILWEQALKSRELRRQERLFMGMGWKPSDIQPRNAAVSNHAVNGDVTGREVVGILKRPNPLVSSLQRGVALPRPDSIGSGSSTSTAGSLSSSSSGRGSMSPSVFQGKYDSSTDNTSLFSCADHNCPTRRASVSSLLYSRPSACRSSPAHALHYSSPGLSRKKLGPQTDAHGSLKCQFEEPIRSKASTEV
ncbi:LOW QUALITY PROTEIN: pleckstrin homology domain-containing family G member 4B [Puntigrus tetrazona]|uniref:LOW QUALITY PROTEIN: pleckstrin homology domain-containing family G member 4B n=1 Tax=Puntigrus tetrazona TaxID=1606681 RepID=UPI001C88F594|nr:LOW QUALITY PROTEIN: pleckstrin homology domain-containing family G member 4B [Puntigrus tetrazona]